jgi:hypothetical protein
MPLRYINVRTLFEKECPFLHDLYTISLYSDKKILIGGGQIESNFSPSPLEGPAGAGGLLALQAAGVH